MRVRPSSLTRSTSRCCTCFAYAIHPAVHVTPNYLVDNINAEAITEFVPGQSAHSVSHCGNNQGDKRSVNVLLQQYDVGYWWQHLRHNNFHSNGRKNQGEIGGQPIPTENATCLPSSAGGASMTTWRYARNELETRDTVHFSQNFMNAEIMRGSSNQSFFCTFLS